MQRIKYYPVFLLFYLFLPACSYLDERPYTIYKTAEEARMSGAMLKGWLPDWLPQSAYKIHEYHDLDTNARAFSFQVRSKDEFKLPVACREAEEVQRPRMKTELFPKEVHTLSYVQICGQVYVVIDHGGIVHGWANSY